MLLFILSVFSLLLSLSRGAAISVLTGMGMYYLYSRLWNKRKLFSFLVLIILSCNVAISTDFSRFLNSNLGNGFASIIEEISGKNVLDNGRVKLWAKTLTLFAESPVVGIGVHARRSWDRELSDGTTHTLSVHNYYLAILLEAGIVGFISVLVLILGLINVLNRNDTQMTAVSFGFVVAVLVHQLTEVSLTTGTLMVGFLAWFVAGICYRLTVTNNVKN